MADVQTTMGIAAVSERTGLSKDALRWYEREGLIPPVRRRSDGRRCYDDRSIALIHLLVRLRKTGMPVAQIRRFVQLMDEGAASHGQRKTLLTQHRGRLVDQMRQLQTDLVALDNKIAHYDELIEAGLDCDGAPVTDDRVRMRQLDVGA